jgi:hypothetical protein
MAFGKPTLEDGLAAFLLAYHTRNGGFTIENLDEIMQQPDSDLRKAQAIRKDAGLQSLTTAKRWMAQWRKENQR